uniref:Fucosyltransferase n=1 Tax=Dendroctonus ponderosae TaxID=77166 RepID=A0AAR5QA88_DENPD
MQKNAASKNVTMVAAIFQRNKLFLVLVVFLFLITFFILTEPNPPQDESVELISLGIENSKIQQWWMRRNASKNLSKLGEILFLEAAEPAVKDSNKRYQILVWKYGPTIENRHLKQFSGQRIDPFEYCSVKNCDITYNDSDTKSADIVIFHLHRITGLADMPARSDPKQIWAFLTDESPFHTFMGSKNKLKEFNGLFNWSMTYRMDSDIPVPYGRTVFRKDPAYLQVAQPMGKRKDVLVAVLGSNCGGQNHRWKYVSELQKYLKVDIYGGCGTLKKQCPGHFGTDCPAINDYLFYLSFENSNCDEYITEKLWWNAYQKNSIPVVMGSTQATYKKLLPPDSYINVDDYASPQVLANYLLWLNETAEYTNYYRWKNYFEIRNEHGYFQSKSYHYCRICQAMNYNDKSMKVYNNLESFWSTKKDCHPAWDEGQDEK